LLVTDVHANAPSCDILDVTILLLLLSCPYKFNLVPFTSLSKFIPLQEIVPYDPNNAILDVPPELGSTLIVYHIQISF